MASCPHCKKEGAHLMCFKVREKHTEKDMTEIVCADCKKRVGLIYGSQTNLLKLL